MRYVPILKGKEGEYAALDSLGVAERNGVVPLIEIPPVPYDYARDENAKSIDEHVASIATRIQKSWRTEPIMLDMRLCETDELSDGRNPLSAALADCRNLGLDIRPVIGTNSCKAYKTAAASHLTLSSRGACVRLGPENFDEDRDLHADLATLLQELRLLPQDADLLIDRQSLDANDRSTNVTIARAWFQLLPNVPAWRSLILAGTSFPRDLSEVDAQTIERVPRREWEVWEALQRKPNLLPRPDLVFSDYAISHPEPVDVDPRMMRMSASIRYTAASSWLVVKGRNVRQHGFEQYFDLCRKLIAEPEYCGRSYSWGDQFIWNCAHGSAGPGNATTWRKVGTNHHLMFVSKHLSSPS